MLLTVNKYDQELNVYEVTAPWIGNIPLEGDWLERLIGNIPEVGATYYLSVQAVKVPLGVQAQVKVV